MQALLFDTLPFGPHDGALLEFCRGPYLLLAYYSQLIDSKGQATEALIFAFTEAVPLCTYPYMLKGNDA
jgi:hypothetical protein